MADFTKKAIRNSFVKLLNEKPLKQISVKDIVDDCGVNRNTFYYHFRDIPDLIEKIVQEDAQRIISEHPSISSLEECLEAVIGFALKYKKAVLHVYCSVNRDIYEQYQWHVCEYAVTTYVDGIMKGRNVSESDRQIILQYLICISFGTVIGWLKSGMKDDIQLYVHRLCQLKQGELEQMIDRCEKN